MWCVMSSSAGKTKTEALQESLSKTQAAGPGGLPCVGRFWENSKMT
jgi:hypothetical protein